MVNPGNAISAQALGDCTADPPKDGSATIFKAEARRTRSVDILNLKIRISNCSSCPSYYYPKINTNMFVITRSLGKFSGGRRLSDSDVPRAKTQRRQVRIRCHFDRREKSFLDPSHSLGMTGIGPSPLRLCAFAGDNPAFGCGSAVLGLCGEYSFTVNPEEV